MPCASARTVRPQSVTEACGSSAHVSPSMTVTTRRARLCGTGGAGAACFFAGFGDGGAAA